MELIVLPALSAAVIASAVNGILTLGVQYIPVIRKWFGGLTSEAKQYTFLGLALLVGLAYFGLGLVDPAILAGAGLAVPQTNVMGLLLALFGALTSMPIGEAVYRALPETADVAEAKAMRDGAAPVG